MGALFNFSRNQAVWVMSVMSIVGSVSRVASGWLADRKFINRRVLFCVAHFVAALAVSSLYICRRYELIMFACIVYSISSGKAKFRIEYSRTCLKRPLKSIPKFVLRSLNAGQK